MDLVGKTFCVQGTHGFETWISVVDATETDFIIHMTSQSAWGSRESTETLSRDLFDSCIRTGYLVGASV